MNTRAFVNMDSWFSHQDFYIKPAAGWPWLTLDPAAASSAPRLSLCLRRRGSEPHSGCWFHSQLPQQPGWDAESSSSRAWCAGFGTWLWNLNECINYVVKPRTNDPFMVSSYLAVTVHHRISSDYICISKFTNLFRETSSAKVYFYFWKRPALRSYAVTATAPGFLGLQLRTICSWIMLSASTLCMEPGRRWRWNPFLRWLIDDLPWLIM